MGKRGATTEQRRIDNCLVYLDLTLCVSECVCVRARICETVSGPGVLLHMEVVLIG